MKRLSCLSALVVGLTMASVTFAAPTTTKKGPAKAKKPPKQEQVEPVAAQAEPPTADPVPAPAPAPPTEPAPAPAPAEPPAAAPEPQPTQPAAPEPQPAVTLGGSSAPGTDKPLVPDADKEKKKPERTWTGSAIYGVTSMTTSTVFKGQMLYNNPTVDSSIWLLPRFKINDYFQLRGRLIFSYEYTNSDTTTTLNEPRFSDTLVQLIYRKLPEFATIKPEVGIQVGVPTSPESRAKTMLFSPGVNGSLSKTFEHVGSGEISTAFIMAYSHPIYQINTKDIRGSDAAAPYQVRCAGGGACDLIGGALNASDTVSYRVDVGGKWGKIQPGLLFLGASQWVYHPKADAPVPIAGGATAQPTSLPDRSSVRQTTYFAATFDYEFIPWLTGEVGYSAARTDSILGEDGKYANPLWGRYSDMRVFLGVTFDPDEFAQAFGKKETGAVKAQNTKHVPVLHY
jgi:hypothetical protein